MAVVIPAVVGWVAAGGGAAIAAAGAAVAAGTAGLAAYATLATVAGGFLSTIGGLTKNQKLAKIGGYLSLAGGVGSIASSMMGAGAAGAGASAVSEAAAESAGMGALGEAAGEAAADSLAAGSLIPSGNLGQAAAGGAAQAGASVAPSNFAEIGAQSAAAQGAEGAAAGASGPNIMDQAQLVRATANPTAAPVAGADATGIMEPVSVNGLGSLGKLGQEASTIKGPSHLESLLKSVDAGLGKVGSFLKDNKELVQLVGSGIESVNDPRREALDAQMSLLEQRRQRLNQPVRLSYSQPGQALPLPMPGYGGG